MTELLGVFKARPSAWLQTCFSKTLLSAVAAALLSAAFLDSRYFYLAWFAFVPFLFALRNTSTVGAYLLGSVFGLMAFALAKFWLFDFIQLSKGFSAVKATWLAALYYLYCAQLFGMAALLSVWFAKQFRSDILWFFPLVLCAVSMAFPMLFQFRLGETQSAFTLAMQGVDLTGVYGLDFVILIVNSLLYGLMGGFIKQNNGQNRTCALISVSIAFAGPLLWFGYGALALSHWQVRLEAAEHLSIGIVQPNEVPNLGQRNIPAGYSLAYPPEMELSEQLSREQKLDLIIWPESQPKAYFDNPRVKNAYERAVASMRTSLLLQDFRRANRAGSEHFNSAVLINEFGQQQGIYDKVKRIPFGEYVPLGSSNSLWYKKTELFLGDYLFKIAEGKSHKSLQHDKAQIVPLICYETTFPSYVAEAVVEAAKLDSSRPLVLIGLSNDGWFNSAHQANQHIIASTVRAVENRLPLVHVSNNGPSIIVSPAGTILTRTHGQQAGAYTANVPFSFRQSQTLFSVFPNGFKYSVYFVFICLLLSAIVGLSRERPSTN